MKGREQKEYVNGQDPGLQRVCVQGFILRFLFGFRFTHRHLCVPTEYRAAIPGRVLIKSPNKAKSFFYNAIRWTSSTPRMVEMLRIVS